MKVALVGATGLVGRVMNEVLEEFDFPVSEYIPVASRKSVGKKVSFKGKEYTIVDMVEAISKKPDVAIFSAGGSTSLEWAPKFAAEGITVIDNSSAWRMDPTKKLCVPEINAHLLTKDDKIIANPNCSTIQMVVALAPIHKKYGIKRLVVSTYQSFTGTGAKAVAQYEAEKSGQKPGKDEMAYHYQIFENAIPQCDVFTDNLYTKEEMKLVNETRKILGDENIKITATAVRIPVNGGHSESVNAELKNPFDLKEIKELLQNADGVTVLDDPETFKYPMPLYSKNQNDVFVGRIRRDESIDNGINLWVVADNLRKGAATNAVQIAQYLLDHHLI
ncbi:MAG: aspartate-semialdehyde dehydrogenase [Saprospiraceae bacterium]|jgi:aspartate-semialdehyde dehydrogenase